MRSRDLWSRVCATVVASQLLIGSVAVSAPLNSGGGERGSTVLPVELTPQVNVGEEVYGKPRVTTRPEEIVTLILVAPMAFGLLYAFAQGS